MDSSSDKGTVGSRLKAARIAAGFKRATHAAEQNRWVVSTYAAHENGNRAPDRALFEYARAFGVDYDWLKNGGRQSAAPLPRKSLTGNTALAGIPLIGRAGAGAFVRVDDISDETPMIEARRHPRFHGARHFALTVQGDSMNDMGKDSLNDGDEVLCVAWEDTGYVPIDGMVLAVEQSINGGHIRERTIKVVRKTPEGFVLEPRSRNSKHKPILLDKNFEDDGREVVIIGLVYGKQHIFEARF